MLQIVVNVYAKITHPRDKCGLQPNPTKGKMRIHCLENVDKSLTFLNEQRVHLENMGAHDIVDGNPRLTLGLIWTIILRFQVRTSSSYKVYIAVTKVT